MTRPAMYFPPAFDRTAVQACAHLVALAYDMCTVWVAQGRPRRESGFRWHGDAGAGVTFSPPVWSVERLLQLINESEPFAFAARAADGTGYLVFRGTESGQDWLDDIHQHQRPYPFAPGFGAAHQGFVTLFGSMQGELERALDSVGPVARWRVTGHSLGSALATLALPWMAAAGRPLARQHYNFASPRVGDPAFASAFNALGLDTYRVVNTADVVPQLPLPVLGHALYEHVGTPVDFTANYGTIAGNHSMANAYRYALDHPDAPYAGRAGGAPIMRVSAIPVR